MQRRSRAVPSAAWLSTLALLMLAPKAYAEPQATVGLTVGAAGLGLERTIWDHTAFHLGLRGDVLFGRTKVTDVGVGPYLEVLTHAFNEVQFGGGASLLIPVFDPLPIVASFGGYARKANDSFGLVPGLAAELFFGIRSYNFHSTYVMTNGVIAQLRYGLGQPRETSVVLGAQLDIAFLGLPLVFLINAIRGGSSETTPIP